MNGDGPKKAATANAPPLDPDPRGRRAWNAPSGAWVRPLVALLPPLVAFVLQSLLWPTLKPHVWLLFYPAVYFSSWFGGLPGGLWATVISIMLVNSYFIPPEASLATGHPRAILSVGVFMAMGILFSFFHGRLRKRTQQATEAMAAVQSAHDKLESRVRERTGELQTANLELQREITEHKRDQQAALEQFKLSETFFNNSVSGLVVLDKDFNFLRVNESYARSCRRDISEFVGRNLFDLFPSDAKAIFEEVVRTKQPFKTFTRPFVFPDQPERGVTHWDWTLVPILDLAGEVEYLVLSLREVTEHKRAEDALRDSEDRYRAIVEGQSELICRWNFTDGITFINEAGCRYLSLPRSEILGRSFEPYVYEEDRPALQAHNASLKPEAPVGGIEHRVRLPTGEVRWTQWMDRAFFDAAGRLLEFQSVGRDITERKLAEAALHESELRFRMVLESVALIGLMLDCAGRIRLCSDHLLALTGWKREEVLGADWFEQFLPPDVRDHIRSEIFGQSLLTGEVPAHYENEIVTRQGERRLIAWSNTLFRDSAGQIAGVASIGEDITERKRAEATLRALSLQLSRAEDAERRRIARELHDSTGQKLAALSMTVGMLQDAAGSSAGKTDRMCADCLATIEECAEEIRTLAYLLHPPLLDELGLAAAVRDYVLGFSKRSGIQVAVDTPPDLERQPDAVEIALFRVVQESLGNIHRHAGASTARLRLACDAEQVTLEVSDSGRGISAETLRALEAGGGASGVGIAGMRERLRLLGGLLEVNSGERGATVRATVPRRQEPT